MDKKSAAHHTRIIGAVLGWIAIAGQFYLIIQNRVYSVPFTVVQFFSYFTILTNILVAITYSMQLLRNPKPENVWCRPQTQAAVAVYILVVGIVYNLVLRFLWAPTGFQKIIDELLHTVVPVVYLLYWTFFAPKMNIQWRHTYVWLIYPLIYLVYVMVRGALTDIYPYPFLDAFNHGYPKVIIASLVIMGLFVCLSLLVIAAAKKMSVNGQQEPIAEANNSRKP